MNKAMYFIVLILAKLSSSKFLNENLISENNNLTADVTFDLY